MNETNPRIEDWKKLYNVLVEIKDIAPWDWLDEHDLFAVQNPETKEIGFVSVMGAIGEHYAIPAASVSERLPLTNLHKKICASEDSSNYEIGEICKSRRAGYAIVMCYRNFVKDYSESYFKMLDV